MNVFELVATLKLDTKGYEEALSDTKARTKSGLAAVGEFAGNAALKVGKATLAVVGATAAGVAAMAKQAVNSYAEYEQLVGGTELLFGDAYKTVMENAQNAYKSVQMSQNDYLKQVNGFAVGLKTALGGNEEAAAQLANKIVTAEADVVAATGNTQENVQNAFNGIMKGNYMMLDNLQLGIKPTKAGFQEVIDTVNEYNEAQGNATNYQIDNLADAQAALVQYIEIQGLAGYAAKEAAGTIQGASAMTKSAWENVISAIAGGGDLDKALNGLVESLFGDGKSTGLITLIAPKIEQAIEGVATLIEKAAPIISAKLPAIIAKILPALIKAATQVAVALIQNLPMLLTTIAQALIENFPIILSALAELGALILEWLVQGLLEIESNINDWFSNIQGSIDAWFQGIGAKISEFIAKVREKASEFIQAGVEMITGFIQSLYHGFLSLLTSVGEWVQANIIQPIKDKVGGMLEAGQDLIARVKEGLQDGFSGLLSAVGGWVNDYIIQPIKNKATEMYNAGKNIIDNLWNGLKDAWAKVKTWWDGLSFSVKRAAVVVDKPAGATQNAGGLEYVPYNNYPALLHVGEMVLTKNQADSYRSGNREDGNGITIVQNISATPQTPVDFAAATAAYFEQARWALV